MDVVASAAVRLSEDGSALGPVPRHVLFQDDVRLGDFLGADGFPRRWHGHEWPVVTLIGVEDPGRIRPTELGRHRYACGERLHALDRHGFKATFYVPPGIGTLESRMEEWRAAARNGHELGNHSLFHQCDGSQPGRDWVQAHRDLHTTTAAQMQDQVRATNTLLQALDGRQERTFTSPCGDRIATDGEYVDGLRDLFVGMKVAAGAHEARSMADFDRYAVPIHAPSDVTGAQLIAQVEEAGRRGTLASFTFHGIGGDHLSVSVQAHEELLAWLDAHRDRYWVAPFVDIARWVRDHPAKE